MKVGRNKYPGFKPVQVPVDEFFNPPPHREGERVLLPDGTVSNFPPPGASVVTVLRRAGTGRGGSKVEPS